MKKHDSFAHFLMNSNYCFIMRFRFWKGSSAVDQNSEEVFLLSLNLTDIKCGKVIFRER